MVYLRTINIMDAMEKKIIKTVLVTGGSGFIGSAITKYLVKKKYKVIVFDNNSRGKISRLKNIKNKITFIKGDIRDRKKLLSVKSKIDTVIHLAYVNGTKFFYKKPFEIFARLNSGLLFCKKSRPTCYRLRHNPFATLSLVYN